MPYFYVHVQGNNLTLTAEEIEKFRLQLNNIFYDKNKNSNSSLRNAILKIELVEKYPLRGGYQATKQKFLKLYFQHPKFLNFFRGVIEHDNILFGKKDCLSKVTYESDIPYAQRFMIDNKICGMSWVRIQADNWTPRQPNKKMTHCQIEFDVNEYSHVQGIPCEGQYAKFAPFRTLSFDIECWTQNDIFPRSQKDPILQISNIVKIQGESGIFVRNIFTLQ